MNTTLLTNQISFLPATDSPLSAEVFLIKTALCTIIFDTGASAEAYDLIRGISSPKTIVLSHFHIDHTANLMEHADILTSYDSLVVGDYTARKFPDANCQMHILDGQTREYVISEEDKIRAIYLPSSHAKGCVLLEAGDIAIAGDGTYATRKGGRTVFNTSLLHETISCLTSLHATKLFLSHSGKLTDKEEMIGQLKRIYNLRRTNETYIDVTTFE